MVAESVFIKRKAGPCGRGLAETTNRNHSAQPCLRHKTEMFDEILSLEADFVDQGRADGLEAGAAKGLLEGGEIGCVVHVSP